LNLGDELTAHLAYDDLVAVDGTVPPHVERGAELRTREVVARRSLRVI